MSLFRKVAVATAMTLTSVFGVPAVAQANAADEAAFLSDINNLRASKGAAPLCFADDLNSVALNWAKQMASAGSISHNPNLAKQVPSGWSKLGENVGVGGDEPSLHRAFENSPGHYANLVDSSFNEVGIAVVESNGRKWVVENFRASKSGAANQAKAAQAQPAKASSGGGSVTSNARSLRARVALDG